MRISDWSSDVCSSDLPTRNSGAPESPPSTAPPCRSALGRDSHYTGKASRPSALLQSHEARMNTTTAPGPGPHGSNFRQSELDKFAALANRWWDPKGPQKALHALNPVRLGYVADRTALRGAKVLDVGCGGGLLSEARDEHTSELQTSMH